VAYGAFTGVSHPTKKIVVKLNERRMGMGKVVLHPVRAGRSKMFFPYKDISPFYFFYFSVCYIFEINEGKTAH
jgi:hypothetical protein